MNEKDKVILRMAADLQSLTEKYDQQRYLIQQLREHNAKMVALIEKYGKDLKSLQDKIAGLDSYLKLLKDGKL